MCNRQDTFLVSHGKVPECLLHSDRQLKSNPRLSVKSDFSCGHSSNTFHHSSESKYSYLSNVPCLCEYGNCLISNLSSRSQTKLFHTDSSHPVCICFCHSCRRASRSFQIQPIVNLFHLQTRCSSLSACLVCRHLTICKMLFFRLLHHSTFCSPKHSQQPSLRNETPSTYIPRNPRVYVLQSSTSLY